MKVESLSEKYRVKRIEEADIPEVYALCKSNPLYYKHCPPDVTINSVKKDLRVLPKGKKLKDKYYIGFYDGNIQSETFWFRNHFEKTGVKIQADGYVIVVMQ